MHRDIKPSNLLLDSRGHSLDNRLRTRKTQRSKNFTHTGDILGRSGTCPRRHSRARPTALGDVYSLGLTLYELLAFRPAFTAKDRARLIQHVTDAEIERLGKVNPEIPRDLETIVHKAIERNPSHRYASCGRSGRGPRALPRRRADPGSATEPGRAPGAMVAAAQGRGAAPGDTRHRSHRRVRGDGRPLDLRRAQCRNCAVERADSRDPGRTRSAWRSRAEAQEQIVRERAELLVREDYVNRVNRAYLELADDNVALAEDLLHGCPPERRGWEWRFVERLCNAERLTIELGNTSVSALAYSPDGTWAVSGVGNLINGMLPGVGTTVETWDVKSGRKQKTLPGAAGTVYQVAVSPDGKKVAAGCTDGRRSALGCRNGTNDLDEGRIGLARNERGLQPRRTEARCGLWAFLSR